MFGLGPMEVMIVLVVGGVVFVLPLAIVLGIVFGSRSRDSPLAICPACRSPNPAKAAFCSRCGEKFES